jgi:transcriptional regulator with XRE-family HTH domain
MKVGRGDKTFDHSGSSFASFLDEESIRGEVESMAVKRVLAWQLERAMRQRRKTKQAMAKELRTSRSQLDRLLDPRNVSVSLQTIARAANVLGKKVVIRIADARPARMSHVAGQRKHSIQAGRPDKRRTTVSRRVG